MTSDNTNMDNIKEANNSFQIKEYLLQLWRKKYWILLSIIICVGISLYYVYRQPRIYGSTAELIILNSYSTGGYTSTGLAAFSDIKGVAGDVNMFNEMEVMKSPFVMEGVVQRLNLDVSYHTPGFGYDNDLYGISPVTMTFMELASDSTASATISKVNDSKVKIYNFKKNGKQLTSNPIEALLGTIIESPIGKIAINATEYYKNFTEPITVKKESVNNTAIKYAAKMETLAGPEFTSIIKLKTSDISQKRANDILNTVMDVYNEVWIAEKNKSAINTSNFIKERLAIIEQELSGIDESISDVKSSSSMPDLASAAQNYYSQSVSYDERAFEASNQLSIASFLRDYLNDPSKVDELIPVNIGLTSNSVETQIEEYNKTLLKRDNLLQNSTAANPVIAELNNNLASMRQMIEQSINNLIAANQIKIKQATGREKMYTGKISSVPGQEKQILSIERQQKVKENLYLYLLQKREENELSGMITVNNTRLIKAATSLGPVAPVRSRYMLMGLFIGLFIPAGLIFLITISDTKVQTRNDISTLSIPFIGEIPTVKGKGRRGLLLKIFNRRSRNQDDEELEIIIKERSRSQTNEAFRMIRTNLDFMMTTKDSSQTIMITSFNPGSGKTFIALNLGTSLALKGKKVVIVDLDLRRASLSKFIGSPTQGITNYLTSSQTDLNSLIIKRYNDNPIDILPIGAIPPNPAELLIDDRYEALIQELKNSYDYILLDCPPLGIVADASISSRMADLTIFVMRAGLFDKSELEDLENVYTENKLPRMSLILNGIDIKKTVYGYRYSRKHEYYVNED